MALGIRPQHPGQRQIAPRNLQVLGLLGILHPLGDACPFGFLALPFLPVRAEAAGEHLDRFTRYRSTAQHYRLGFLLAVCFELLDLLIGYTAGKPVLRKRDELGLLIDHIRSVGTDHDGILRRDMRKAQGF
ncbi:hypothetical protein SDC9_173195 [bioreactor metagenome]|uniref:Uncharacterized protein n=1 Tax=bioreactor metagenome TaxID=1076179 RepID=A0A645GHY6_9ZZZZ